MQKRHTFKNLNNFKKQTKTKQHKSKSILLPVLAALILVIGLFPQGLSAQSRAELSSRSESLQREIKSSEAKLEQLADKKDTLENRIESITTEKDKVKTEIKLTNNKISETKAELKQIREDLERNKELVRENARTVYKNKDTSAIEVLFSSSSLSDFISRQEYLSSARESLNEASSQIKSLESELEKQRNAQQKLSDRLQAQRATLSARESEQQRLLEQTEGQEERYQEQVAANEAEYERTEQRLQEIIAQAARAATSNSGGHSSGGSAGGGGNTVSQGTVNRGDVIGRMGSTGLSTGPHLHFEVRQGSTRINPYSGSGLINGYSWPVGGGGGYISQHYGKPSVSFYAQHSGLDVADVAGTPILAAAGGKITFRGDLGAYGNAVIIDHGNGYSTLYGHMLPW